VASNLISLNTYTKGNSNVKGDFLVSTNDPGTCYTGTNTITDSSDFFIPEDDPNRPLTDQGCGYTGNNDVPWWYPINSIWDGGSINYNNSNTTGYSILTNTIKNANSSSVNFSGKVTSYDCGYTHATFKATGRRYGQIWDTRNGVYQPVGFMNSSITMGATLYTPNDYMTVNQGSSFGGNYNFGYNKNQGNLLVKNVYGKLYCNFTAYPIYSAGAGGGVAIYDLTLNKADGTTLYSGGNWTGIGTFNMRNPAYNGQTIINQPAHMQYFNPGTYYNIYTYMFLLPVGAGFNGQCLPEVQLKNGNSANYATGIWIQLSEFFNNLKYTWQLSSLG
jgi:hypothetical protein